MVLTKQDLQEWNSHPVTKAVFKKIEEEIQAARMESSMMQTADETALRTAYKEGFIDGGSSLKDAYEYALEEAE